MILVALAAFGCPVSRSEVHLIPAGYTGDVFIIWGLPEGIPAERDGFTSVFRIPADGILITQDSPSAAWHLAWYYRVDSEGQRHKLELEASTVHNTPENRASTVPIVWFPRSGESDFGGCKVRFVQYYVGTRANLLERGEYADQARFREAIKRRGLCEHPAA